MNRSRYYFPDLHKEYKGPFAGYFEWQMEDGRYTRKYYEKKPHWIIRLLSVGMKWFDVPNSYIE